MKKVVFNKLYRWNVTFTDYSSNVLPEETSYPLLHYSSTSDGRLITVDAPSGDILWQRRFDSPIVAIFVIEKDGLHRLPMTILGKETLDNLLESTDAGAENSSKSFLLPPAKDDRQQLYPTLFVGEFSHGLYALPSLVDERTATIVVSEEYMNNLGFFYSFVFLFILNLNYLSIFADFSSN